MQVMVNLATHVDFIAHFVLSCDKCAAATGCVIQGSAPPCDAQIPIDIYASYEVDSKLGEQTESLLSRTSLSRATIPSSTEIKMGTGNAGLKILTLGKSSGPKGENDETLII
jgi:hypothetical protein